jgi:hypothetical protein
MMRALMLALIMAIALAGCSSYAIHDQFDRSLDAYNEAIRWLQWGTVSLYTENSIREESDARAAAAKDVRMIDYRIVNKTYDAEKGEATVAVDIDYYKVPSLTVRTVRYTEKWVYLDENGTKRWRLTSLLPEFR